MKSKSAALQLMAFMSMGAIATNTNNTFFEDEPRRIQRSRVHPNQPTKQGQKKFTYPDGFECEALNQKNADRKHNKWINRNS